MAQQGKFERALYFFDGALGVAPPEEMLSRIRSDIAKAYTALGVRANEERDYEKALTFMRFACEAELSAVNRYNLGLAYALFAEHSLSNEQYSAAAEFFERAIDAGFTNAEVLNNLGVALVSKGDLELAMAAFERALQMDPQNDYIQANLNKARAFVPSLRLGAEPGKSAEAKPNLSILDIPYEFQRQTPIEAEPYIAA